MAELTIQPDPTAGKDASISQAAANQNYGTADNLVLGKGASGIYRALIQFPLTGIPAGQTISSAIMSLYIYEQGDAVNRDVSAHRALTQWYEGDKPGDAPPTTDGSTWNHRNYNGLVTWAGGAGGAAGSDWTAIATATTTIIANTYQFYTWDVTADVQAWYAGTANNYGHWMIGQEGTSQYKRAYSSDYTTDTAKRPKLVVTYTPAATGNPWNYYAQQ